MSSDDPLELLRCRKGCDTRFLDYLIWEGTNLRVCDGRREWKKDEPVGVNHTIYDIGLRCSDCGMREGHRGVPHDVKEALDDMLASVAHSLQDLADQHDTDILRELVDGTADMMEGSDGAA